ncbi:MAG: nucleotidyltransferase family protein [Bacteroidia bacterium]|nr:nucleotidyltransferase family protein [Bacteroidia bacterium]
MEAIVLAGGMGTRLREVVSDVPKPMAPINGKPFLFYLFQWLKQYPVERLILSTGYMSDCIMEYFGNSFCSIPVEYVIEEKPLGTGGAVRYALQKTSGSNILIINGDTYFPIDLNNFYLLHTNKNHLFSIALKRMQNFYRYGSVECHENTIIKFNEKKICSDGLINGGIYLVNRQFFESKPLPEVFSLENEILEKEAGSSILKGFVFDNLFIDIGLPEDYHRAESILTTR